MTFIKSCNSCSYEIDLESLSPERLPAWSEYAQCPYCYETVEVPSEYWE